MQRYNMTRLWNWAKRTPLGRMIQRECDIPLALDIHRGVQWAPSMAEALGRDLLANPIPMLKGATGYGNESRRWLLPDVAGVLDFSSTGSKCQFNIFDWMLVDVIGFTFGVAGTTTACRVDFDRYPAMDAKGTIIAAKLDGTNGTVTAPNITTAMAIGAVVYKNIGDLTGPVLVNPGNSIDVNVATACTLGTNAMAFVVGYPKPDSYPGLTTAFIGT